MPLTLGRLSGFEGGRRTGVDEPRTRSGGADQIRRTEHRRRSARVARAATLLRKVTVTASRVAITNMPDPWRSVRRGCRRHDDRGPVTVVPAVSRIPGACEVAGASASSEHGMRASSVRGVCAISGADTEELSRSASAPAAR